MNKITLMTALGAGNLGDELIAWCEYQFLREHYPKVHLLVYTYEHSDGLFARLSARDHLVHMRQYFPSNIRKHPLRNIVSLWKMLYDISTSDTLIIGGGGLWYDNESGQNSLTQRLQWLLRIWVAKIARTRILFWWAGIDVAQKHIKSYRSIFSGNHSLAVVRDHHSSDLLKTIGIPSVIGTDSVIALSQYFRALLPKEITPRKQPLSLGISVRSWYHDSETDILKNLVRQLRSQYPHSTIYGLAYSHREDNSLVSDTPLLRSLGLDHIITNQEEILKTLPTLNIMIATRLHAMITARLINIPTLCLSYAKKTREIHSALDSQWYGYGMLSDIHTLREEDISDLLSNFEQWRLTFLGENKKGKNDAMAHKKIILDWISQKNPS